MTQEDRQGVPIGHGAFLGRRRLVIVKCVARLSGGLETSGDVSQGEFVESALARKASLLALLVPVPQTDTGGRG